MNERIQVHTKEASYLQNSQYLDLYNLNCVEFFSTLSLIFVADAAFVTAPHLDKNVKQAPCLV